MDSTALERQNRRIQRLADGGVQRSTVFVHRDCKAALDGFRPYFSDPSRANELLKLLGQLDAAKAASLAQFGAHRSPFRYPGGKSWLVRRFRHWFADLPTQPAILVEPFAGGGGIGLAVAADMQSKVVFADLDDDVAAVWTTIFHRPAAEVEWLCERIEQFEMTEQNVLQILERRPRNRREIALRTIVLNRTRRAGVLADGAGHLRRGENGKGLKSRWYPQTLTARIREMQKLRGRVSFRREDAFAVLEEFADRQDVAYFLDPPYTAGGREPGKRLYRHNDVDHRRLLKIVKRTAGPAMLTYADTPEIRSWAMEFGYDVAEATMQTAHHKQMKELLLTKA